LFIDWNASRREAPVCPPRKAVCKQFGFHG
jgi:hypothetical protein